VRDTDSLLLAESSWGKLNLDSNFLQLIVDSPCGSRRVRFSGFIPDKKFAHELWQNLPSGLDGESTLSGRKLLSLPRSTTSMTGAFNKPPRPEYHPGRMGLISVAEMVNFS
jgi:hypothetical protein